MGCDARLVGKDATRGFPTLRLSPSFRVIRSFLSMYMVWNNNCGLCTLYHPKKGGEGANLKLPRSTGLNQKSQWH